MKSEKLKKTEVIMVNNEIIEKEENRECDKKQAINKNAKKSWRDGGIFAVLALLIYSFQVNIHFPPSFLNNYYYNVQN